MDTALLGQTAADLMDRIAEDFPDAELGVVAVIAEISSVDEDDDPGWTTVVYRCSDNRRWVQAGLFVQAGRAVHES